MATIKEAWLAFLVDVELAKHYNQVDVHSRSLAPNPILDALLPSLLYVRLGSLLDDFFGDHIINKRLVMPRSYRNDLNGKISFLNDQSLLKDASKLHGLRLKRNELAHEAEKSCTWKDLDDATNDAEAELQHLGLVGSPPKFEFYAERKPRASADPGCFISFDYCYGLRINGAKHIEVSWQQNLNLPGQ